MAEKNKAIPPEMKEKLRSRYNEDWRKDLRKSVPAKERMKISRQKMPERDPFERNHDFSINWQIPYYDAPLLKAGSITLPYLMIPSLKLTKSVKTPFSTMIKS